MNLIRQEHPNPQFERNKWINLNGIWEFEIDSGVSGRDRKLYEAKGFSQIIMVPFCPESELSGITHRDFMNAVWYRKEIILPADWNHGRIHLHFGAVDYEAYIYVNSEFIGLHRGGYSSFEFDITEYVKSGSNVIILCAEDDPRANLQPRGKQSENFYSVICDYSRVTGIWQTVWLELVPEEHIECVRYFTDPINGVVRILAELKGSGNFRAKVFYKEQLMGEQVVKSNGELAELTIPLKEKHLWEPGHGRLYNVELIYGEDYVHSYFGLRSVRLDGMKFLINEQSVFQRLVLDQGYYPDGIYTAPYDEAMIQDIQISLDAGFNGARLHEKVFEPRFLYHCDKMGYLVWGEFGNWGIDISNPASLGRMLTEWLEVMKRDWNHPSIIGWCPLNETADYKGHRQDDEVVRCIYRTTKLIDNSRPCIDTSGFFHVETDIYDLHDYEQDPEVFQKHYAHIQDKKTLYDVYPDRQKYKGEPIFISEYGGMLWSLECDDNGWGYGDAPKTEIEFIERYRQLTDTLLNNRNIFGFCYTQLYDIEQEKNGLYTYERKAKFDMSIIKSINSRMAAIEKHEEDQEKIIINN